MAALSSSVVVVICAASQECAIMVPGLDLCQIVLVIVACIHCHLDAVTLESAHLAVQ